MFVGYQGGSGQQRARGGSGHAWIAHNASHWPLAMRKIYEEHGTHRTRTCTCAGSPTVPPTPMIHSFSRTFTDVFFADTLVGSRNFESLRGSTVLDRVQHDSHLLVIRRRLEPRTRKVKMHRWQG